MDFFNSLLPFLSFDHTSSCMFLSSTLIDIGCQTSSIPPQQSPPYFFSTATKDTQTDTHTEDQLSRSSFPSSSSNHLFAWIISFCRCLLKFVAYNLFISYWFLLQQPTLAHISASAPFSLAKPFLSYRNRCAK